MNYHEEEEQEFRDKEENKIKKLEKSKNNEERNKIQVDSIKNGIRDLKEEIEDLSEQEKEIKNPNETVDIAEIILEFSRQQQVQGLKILTSNQTLSRSLISLAQLKAGNYSEKLKNKIRKLLYFLYRSKKTSIKIWLTLFKDGNNFYEQWK